MKSLIISLIAAAGLLTLVGCETTPPPPPRPPAHLPAPSDIKVMSQAGIADEVIISQIRNSRVVFRLTAQQIIELKESGVSPQVLDFMINTPRLYSR